MREFETGATRDSAEDKIDPEGFISPTVELAFCEYMHRHRKQADGKLRASDNWQKGMPFEEYLKSAWRHFLDIWLIHRGHSDLAREGIEEALCALKFNVNGMLYEYLNGSYACMHELSEAEEKALDDLVNATEPRFLADTTGAHR